jgi:ferredoxin-NADP reductase
MNARVSVRCDSAAQEAGGVKVFALRLPSAAHEQCHDIDPGRYVALEYADMAGGVQQRMYSVTRKPAPDVFEIAVRRTGTHGVADRLHASLEEGAAVTLLYAGGDITVDAVLAHRQVLMWAGGIGVTLPVALLRELAELEKKGWPVPRVTLYLCCPRVQDVPFLPELLEMDLTCAWFDMQIFITRQPIDTNSKHFRAGRPTDDMLAALPAPGAVLLCGSHQFAVEARGRVRELYPHAELLIESFSAPKAEPPAQTELRVVKESAVIAIAGQEGCLPADPSRTLLENFEQHGVPVRSQCRSGICGSCRIRIVSGDCRRDADFCLDDSDVSKGYALACCTYPTAGQLTVALGPDC